MIDLAERFIFSRMINERGHMTLRIKIPILKQIEKPGNINNSDYKTRFKFINVWILKGKAITDKNLIADLSMESY